MRVAGKNPKKYTRYSLRATITQRPYCLVVALYAPRAKKIDKSQNNGTRTHGESTNTSCWYVHISYQVRRKKRQNGEETNSAWV